MVTYIIAAESEQYCAHEPPDRTDNEEFFCCQMSKAEDVTKIIFWESRDEKQQENKECPLVVKEVVVAAHRLSLDEFFGEGPSERPGKTEGDPRTKGQAYCGEYSAQEFAVEEAPHQARNLSRDGGNDNLCSLETDKADKRQ